MTGQKVFPNYKNNEDSRFNAKTLKKHQSFCENQGGVKTTAGSETSRVSGNYHKRKEPLCHGNGVKIRHVFGDTCFRRAAPPVIVKLSGRNSCPDFARLLRY